MINGLWTDGNRIYRIIGLNRGVIVYEDCYQDYTEERVTSEIQWIVDAEKGVLWKIGE